MTEVVSARLNRIRSVIAEGGIPLGMQSFSGSSSLVEIIGYAGFDFVMLDTEHSCIDASQIETLVRAAEAAGLTPLVRVAENDRVLIRTALEAGCAGVFVPQIRTAADVESALEAARFPPVGTRGACVSVRGSAYSIERWKDFVRWTNEELLVIPILEHPDAIENAESICRLEGVHIVLFGPGDLGLALGLGVEGMTHPRIQAMLDDLIEIGRQTETLVMCVPFPDLSAEACRDLIGRGVRVLLHSIDELLFSRLCRGIVSELSPVLRPSGTITDGRKPPTTGQTRH